MTPNSPPATTPGSTPTEQHEHHLTSIGHQQWCAIPPLSRETHLQRPSAGVDTRPSSPEIVKSPAIHEESAIHVATYCGTRAKARARAPKPLSQFSA
jgi:hypothetical protein